MERLETQVDTILDEDNFNPSRTIIVQRLSDEPGKTPHDLAQALVRDGLGLPTEVVRAKRLQGRNGRPGLLKAELPSQDHKVAVLKRKQNLKASQRYGNVYIRSSQTHEERVAQSNLMVIVDTIPELKGRYRFAGNGRPVEKTIPGVRSQDMAAPPPPGPSPQSRNISPMQHVSPVMHHPPTGAIYLNNPPPSYGSPMMNNSGMIHTPNQGNQPPRMMYPPHAPMVHMGTPRPPRRDAQPRQLDYNPE